MTDMSGTIRANSDQLNAVDLMGGGVVVTVKSSVVKNGDKQSLWMELEEDFNTFKPCLSMRRVIMDLWGSETDDHIGKKLVLYCEPSVKWSGKEEGGVRISHASNIDSVRKITLRESKYKTVVWEVQPLKSEQRKQEAKQEPVISAEQFAILLPLATVTSEQGVVAWTPTAGDVMTENNIPNIDQLPASKFDLVKKQLEANNV